MTKYKSESIDESGHHLIHHRNFSYSNELNNNKENKTRPKNLFNIMSHSNIERLTKLNNNLLRRKDTSYYHDKLEKLEKDMLEHVNSQERFYVEIKENPQSNKILKIWTLAVNRHSKKTPVVFVHGFMAGFPDWKYNINSLSDSRPVYAIDLIGFGRSTRVKFSNDPLEAENQFIDAIEEWRKMLRLEKIILVGHSFGGYLSTLYSIKYPQNTLGLVLEDPWGFDGLNFIFILLF
jgi:hypothetical protein